MYPHKSGAQKRKEKQVREEADPKCARTLFEVRFKKIADKHSVDEHEILPSGSASRSLDAQQPQEAETEEVKTVPDAKSTDTTEQQMNIGLIPDRPSRVMIENYVRKGLQPVPKQISPDHKGYPFPHAVLKVQRQNGEIGNRDWLVYSQSKSALFCFPCRLFVAGCTQQPTTPSHLATCGIGKQSSWKKLYNRIPEHEHTMIPITIHSVTLIGVS